LGYLIETVTGLTYYDYIKNNILIPLKMNNTSIDDCNITLYTSKIKELTKYQHWIRSLASSAGELTSCINDLIKFTKFTKLLSNYNKTLHLLKEMYICTEKDGNYIIAHTGDIIGGHSELNIIYDKNWKIKNIYILLKTGI
jgi:CubicO group peptidase (beta-lactamase class C family)